MFDCLKQTIPFPSGREYSEYSNTQPRKGLRYRNSLMGAGYDPNAAAVRAWMPPRTALSDRAPPMDTSIQSQGRFERWGGSRYGGIRYGFRRARSRLYRSQILQVNIRWKALAEIYTMHSFAPFSNLNFFVKNC